jgi:hypothetical protein
VDSPAFYLANYVTNAKAGHNERANRQRNILVGSRDDDSRCRSSQPAGMGGPMTSSPRKPPELAFVLAWDQAEANDLFKDGYGYNSEKAAKDAIASIPDSFYRGKMKIFKFEVTNAKP